MKQKPPGTWLGPHVGLGNLRLLLLQQRCVEDLAVLRAFGLSL